MLGGRRGVLSEGRVGFWICDHVLTVLCCKMMLFPHFRKDVGFGWVGILRIVRGSDGIAMGRRFCRDVGLGPETRLLALEPVGIVGPEPVGVGAPARRSSRNFA